MLDDMTSRDGRWLTYRCAPAITWLRDADQMLLVDGERERFWSIRGVEAVIWDLLTLAYPYEKIVRFLSLMGGTSSDEAEKTLRAVVYDWRRAGIVELVEDNERG